MSFWKTPVTTAFAAVLMLNAVPSAAAEAPEVCDRFFAYDTLDSGDYDALCDCSAVTKPFLRVIQRSEDFSSVLSRTADQCAALTNLLTDPVVQSSAIGLQGDDLRPDAERDTGNPGGDSPGNSDPSDDSSPGDDDGGIYNGF